MTTTAIVVQDSINDRGGRLTTLQLRYPRLVHAEFMTHRAFSRNASSSRAIPVERLIQDVIDDPAIPCHWGANQPGMQARAEHDALIWAGGGASYTAKKAWLQARNNAVNVARAFADAGYHKQVANRLLEPFAHINVVVTATDWENFFDLRLHEDAEPNIQLLARAMKAAMDGSQPILCRDGQWHLPYVASHEFQDYGDDDEALKAVSVARCARVSYKTHDGAPTDFLKDKELGERLSSSGHWSPFEHQATPAWGRHANFMGWQSLRTGMGQ